jgi:hypothetical protein
MTILVTSLEKYQTPRDWILHNEHKPGLYDPGKKIYAFLFMDLKISFRDLHSFLSQKIH